MPKPKKSRWQRITTKAGRWIRIKRRWIRVNWKRWAVVVLVLVVVAALIAAVVAIFVARKSVAEGLGYAAVITEIINDSTGETVKKTSTSYPDGRFLREFIIALAAFAVIIFTGIRSWASFTQSKVEGARLLDARFATAAQLMALMVKENNKDKPAIAARIGGIYTMEKLAKSVPEEFAEQVVKNLIAYIKGHVQLTATLFPAESKVCRRLGEDVKSAFAALHNILSDKGIKAKIDSTILDFSYQDFSRLSLNILDVNLSHYKKWTGANFQESSLMVADFKKALLRKANFRDANLTAAYLTGANLSSADMTATMLAGAKLTGANLSNADMTAAMLVGANLHEAKLHDTNLTKAFLMATEFQNADMKGANLYETRGKEDLSGAKNTDKIVREKPKKEDSPADK